jgi:putative ATP-binding cassette transporter
VPSETTGAPRHDPQRDQDVLRQIQLGHLCERLDETDHWGNILSLGEQQRLAFGRLLLARPTVAFLDEATSAMDEGLEDAMYSLIRKELPSMRLVSVGHRSTLRRYHTMELTLQGGGTGGWVLTPIS